MSIWSKKGSFVLSNLEIHPLSLVTFVTNKREIIWREVQFFETTLPQNERCHLKNEKMKMVNFIELEFRKTKGARNENVFLIEGNFMVAKRGRTEETIEENSQCKKMKKLAREKGNRKSQRRLGMQDFSISTEQMPYSVIEDTKKANITMG